HQLQRGQAVPAGVRVVAEARQQQLVGQRADAALRRLHQAEAQVARRGGHAVEEARHPPRRRQNQAAAGVAGSAPVGRLGAGSVRRSLPLGPPVLMIASAWGSISPSTPPLRNWALPPRRFAAASSGPSRGSKLTVTTVKSSFSSKAILRRLSARPLSTTEHSRGHL